MARVARLAVLAVLLFVAFSHGLPWVRDQLGMFTATEGPGLCVSLADRANDTFSDGLGSASASGDSQVWGGFVGRVQVGTQRAKGACTCQESSCGRTLQALGELESLLDRLDVRARGGTLGRIRPDAQQHVNQLLAEARDLVRQGS